MVVLTATVNEVRERQGQRAPAARWGFLSAAAAFLATKRWQRECCKQLAPWNSTTRGGWSSFEPEPGDNRGHESSNKRREEAIPSLMSTGLQQLMCLREAANLETPCLPTSPGSTQEYPCHTSHLEECCFSHRPTV